MAKIKGGELTFILSDDGSLKLVEQKAKKTAGAMNRVGQTAHSADRSLKGAAQASSGASKNFSKLSQGITGGLVPAYATLAANLFAVDALFRFLKTSADFRVLTQGQEAFAAATGVAYKSLAHDLQTATRNMINFRDAAQAGAIGRAAGLSAGQLTELSEAAFKVSMALGRDVTDSFNRLIRGVTKAEPELLDELGIVLRLEEATTKYAASLGLNKNQLSIYQKSQAVVNEVLDQAERKFGKINAIMEPNANAVAQLGVAFEKTIDSIRPLVAAFAEPIGQFFTNNIQAAAIAMGLFATTIINSVIPSHHDLLVTQAKQTAAHEEQLERLRVKTETLQAARAKLAKTPIAQEKFMKKMKKGGLDVDKIGGESGKALRAGQALTNKQIGAIKAQITKGTGAFAGMTESMKLKYTAMLDDMKGKTSIAQQKILLSFESVKNGVQIKTTQMQIFWEKAMGRMAAATRTVTIALSGIMTFLSYLGIAVLIFQAGKAAYDKFFGPDQGHLDSFNDRLNKVTESTKNLNEELIKMGEVARRGLLENPLEEMEHLGEAVASANLDKILKEFKLLEQEAHLNEEAFEEFRHETLSTFNAMQNLHPEFKKYADELRSTGTLLPESIKDLRQMTSVLQSQGQAVKGLREVEGELIKQQNRIVQSLPKVPYQDMLLLLEKQISLYKEIGEEGEANLELVSANLEYYLKIQERSLALEKEIYALKKLQATSGLGGARETKASLDYASKLLSLRKEEYKIDELQLQIKAAKQKEDSLVTKGLKDQLELAEANLEVMKMQVTVAGLMANNFFSTYNDMFTGLYEDFGKGIGAAIRGEEGAFDKLGQNLKNTLSNAMGDAIAKQFLDDVLPDELKPEDIAEKINDAGTYHGDIVKDKIMEGGVHHANSIVGVANAMTQELSNIFLRQDKAKSGVLGSEISRLGNEKGRAEKRQEYLKSISSEGKIDQFIQTAQGRKEANEFARNEFNKKELIEFNNREKEIKSLLEGRAKITSMQAADDDDYYQDKNIRGQGGITYANKLATYDKKILDLESQNAKLLNKHASKYEEHLNKKILDTKEEIDQIDNKIKGIEGVIENKAAEKAALDASIAERQPDEIKTLTHTSTLPTETTTDSGEEVTGIFGDKFSENLNKFSGTIGLLGAVAGEDEKVARIMTIVAKLQMANALMERINIAKQAAMQAAGGSKFGAFFGALIGGRQGGIMSMHGRSYSQGGVADGPTSGYPAMLHGREAVVPLPNGRSIPVDIGKANMGTNNVSINVNMAEGTTDTTTDAQNAKDLGAAINTAVLKVIEKEQRTGGLLA